MKHITKEKSLNHHATIIMHHKGLYHYPETFSGASTGYGENSNLLCLHIGDSDNETNANSVLDAVGNPSCEVSGLTITVNCGSCLDDDETVITADTENTKYVKVCIVINDTTGALSVEVLTKTTGEYGDISSGNTLVQYLKEYSVVANGSTLTLVEDFIDG